MKINRLEIENVKRVKAVRIEPAANGLTVIGGRNGQGKTSVLDAIAWALGGNKNRPSMPTREGSVIPPTIKVIMDNGLVVERKGKNSDLKVTDPAGKKSGQQLLDSFVAELALDLPKFLQSNGKEKAETLLKVIGVGDQLAILERQEQGLYNQRTYVGQTADQKEKFAKEQQFYPDVPDTLVSASELINQQQDILARNGENQRKRRLQAQYQQEVDSLTTQLQQLQQQLAAAQSNLAIAQTNALDLLDQSTAELEQSILNIEEINAKVRANLNKEMAEDDAKEYRNQYNTLTHQIEAVRTQKSDLLLKADLPLAGLAVEDGNLKYNGYPWDGMSGSEQLKVATAIVRKLNPNCGFVLLDKLEQMDIETLNDFGAWLEQEGLQAIATRVSTGAECSIIIEDGMIQQAEVPMIPTYKAGVF